MDTKILFNKILQLAIEGKLLSQIEIEGSAKDLIAEIENEKKRQIDERNKIKLENNPKSKLEKYIPPQPIPDKDKLFDIPSSWEWVRLGDIAYIKTGATPNTLNKDYYNGTINWINSSSTNQRYIDKPNALISNLALKETNCSIIPKGSLIIAMYGQGKTRGQVSELLIDSATNQACASIVHILPKLKNYLYYFFVYNYEIIRIKAEGGVQPNLNLNIISNILIPLPPLQEQQRISTTLEAIKNKLDIYEENQLEISKNADLLKKQLLHQAICGKLVSQNPDEGSANDLIKQIEAEKKRLIEEEYQNAINKAKQEGKSEKEIKKIKKKEYVAPQPISPDDYPFDIPASWRWVRLGEIGTTNTGSTPPKTNPNYFGNYIPFLSPGNIKNNVIVSYETQGLSEEGYKIARPTPQGTIIQVCIGGSIGKCAITDKEITFNQQINSITPFLVLSKYVFIVLASKWFVGKMLLFTAGSATPIINKSMWESQYFPLPPLSEQRRIVEKLEELFVEIDKLK